MNQPHFDFSAVDELLDEGLREHDAALESAEPEEEDWEPFESNVKQAELRAAAKSGDYDTLFSVGTISSGKTYGAAHLITELCLEYPETEVLVVRAKRSDLEDLTIPDFMAACPPDALRPGKAGFNRSKLNQVFQNASRILYRSANEQADKLFAWLKGRKPDILLIDECDQESREFVSMAMSRVGVQRRRSRASIPKVKPLSFMICNPNLAWPAEYHTRFVHRPESLKAERTYFQKVTIEDNKKFISPEKLAQWKRTMTEPMYNRFVKGSWDAMSDLEQLILFEYMEMCRELIPNKLDPKGAVIPWATYLGVDPARYGPDKCAFLLMKGPNLHRLEFNKQTSIPQVYEHVKRLMAEENISPHHVTIDVVGLGAGVVDMLAADGIFVNAFNGAEAADDAVFYQPDPEDPNSKTEMGNYHFTFLNKRASAFWEVMQMLKAGKIGGFSPEVLGWQDDVNLYEVLRQDLASIHYQFAKGTKAIKIEDKEEIKKRLKRSPDFADVLKFTIQSYLADIKKPSTEIFTL